MEKKFSVQGSYGSFDGVIKITKNYTSETKDITNAITHDDITVTVRFHKVEAFIVKDRLNLEGSKTLWKSHLKIATEQELEGLTLILEEEFKKHLEFISNNEPVKTFEERMKEKGYL